jgi:hypothetical protein
MPEGRGVKAAFVHFVLIVIEKFRTLIKGLRYRLRWWGSYSRRADAQQKEMPHEQSSKGCSDV